MNIAAALGLDNDPAQKAVRNISNNFRTLFQLKSNNMKEKEAYRTRRDVFLRREARDNRRYVESIPAFNNPEGFMKNMKEDNSAALMLLLGGGLIAAAMIGVSTMVKRIKDWVKDVQKYLYEKFNIFGWSPFPRPASEIEDIAELPNVGSPTGADPPADSESPATAGGSESISPAPQSDSPAVSSAPAAAEPALGGQLSKSQVRKLALGAGFSPSEAATVVGIAGAESRRIPSNSTKKSGLYQRPNEDSVGLMQINWGYHKNRGWLQKLGITKREQLFDPATNMKAAKYLYDGRGNFGDWSVYNSGKYREWLQQGGIAGRRKKMNSLRNGAAPAGQDKGASKAAPPPEPTYGVQHLIRLWTPAASNKTSVLCSWHRCTTRWWV